MRNEKTFSGKTVIVNKTNGHDEKRNGTDRNEIENEAKARQGKAVVQAGYGKGKARQGNVLSLMLLLSNAEHNQQ